MTKKLVRESLDFERGQGPKKGIGIGIASKFPTIFIDEDEFDQEDPEDYPDFDGISDLPIYWLPEEISEENTQELIDEYSDNRDKYEKNGYALIGFTDGAAELIELFSHNGEEPSILYPSI